VKICEVDLYRDGYNRRVFNLWTKSSDYQHYICTWKRNRSRFIENLTCIHIFLWFLYIDITKQINSSPQKACFIKIVRHKFSVYGYPSIHWMSWLHHNIIVSGKTTKSDKYGNKTCIPYVEKEVCLSTCQNRSQNRLATSLIHGSLLYPVK